MAEGICDVVNAKMAQAIRTLTVEKGIEPRDFSIVAFGGAGAMHAAFLARELEIPEVIVPPLPGAFSAWGMLETELRKDLSLSYYAPFATADRPAIVKHLEEMEAAGRRSLLDQDVPDDAIRAEHSLDLRYVGQEYTLTVPTKGPEEVRDDRFAEVLGQRFHEAHLQRFGHSNPGAPIEIVVLRTTVLGDLGRPEPTREALDDNAPVPFTQRQVVFDGIEQPTKIIRRSDLVPGARAQGPAIISEATATTVLPPGSSLFVDELRSLIIDVGLEE
jgi:N-methylhydantoinase A